MSALEGIRIVDCSHGVAGPRLTQLLADHGADVAWIEPIGGDPYREVLAIEYSVFNRGKRSVVVDLTTSGGVEDLRTLCSSADIFVHSWRPGVAERLGLSHEELHARAPGLITCSITGFGDTGPYRDVPGYEALVHSIVGTTAEQAGMRPAPIFEGMPFASVGAAYLGAVGVLGALYRRHLDGAGRHVETSLLDGALSYLMMLWGDSDRGPGPHLPGGVRIVARSFECSDGLYIGVHTGAVGAFGRLMKVLGLDDRVPAIDTAGEMGVKLTDEQAAIVANEIPTILASRSRSDWLSTLRSADICAVEHLHPCEVFDQPQTIHNEMVVTLDDPVLGVVQQVAPAAKFSVTPALTPKPAPTVGQHTSVVFEEWTDGRALHGGDAENVPLLDGLRVLDLGAYYAGPYSSRLLADLGADVIKLEPTAGDPLRGLTLPFRSASAGKRSIALNLKDPELRSVRTHLIEWADVIHHNMRPGAAERLGLGYEDVRAVKPEAVYLYAPGWGSSGPDRDRQSFAPKMSGYVGAGFEVAGEFNPPLFPIGNEDPGNGLIGAVGALMALVYRQRTGSGQYVENPQLNATMTHLAHIVRRENGEVLGAGRLDVLQYGFSALERLYETSDGWVCLAALAERDVGKLHAAVGPTLADEWLASQPARVTHDDDIAQALGVMFESDTTSHWIDVLGQAGVPIVEPKTAHNSVVFLRDPENRASRRVAETDHPRDGKVREIDQLIRVSDVTYVTHRVAPDIGEHTDEVLQSFGYDEEQLVALRLRGVIR